MKQLIHPAIALMNRLPMLVKFGLISVLFLLPISGLSWLVISELNRSVAAMTRGVEGLDQLRQVERLVVAAMDYRDYRAPGVVREQQALLELTAAHWNAFVSRLPQSARWRLLSRQAGAD